MVNDDKVYFDPEYGRQFLDVIQDLFYNASTHKGGNGELVQKALRLITEMLDRKDPYFKDNYNLFADSLHDALEWVWKKPVEVTTTEWQETVISQQTYADRKNEYANRLVLLPIGQVMVKTPSGEHVMETDVPKTAKEQRAALPSIRKRVLDQTIRDYCKSRHAVEEEIRKRQEPPLPPVSQHYTV